MGEAVMKVVETYTKNKLIALFLLAWAATFFFSALSGFSWLPRANEPILELVFDVLYYLAKLGCAVFLAMLGLKILNKEKEPAQEE